ncbi:MAG TPA: hypothetical protein VIY86_12225 [Pirellulaceae bacterium]
MVWARWFHRWMIPFGLANYASQLASRCEEPAWSLVEPRAGWLSAAELRGYVRARTRLLVEEAVAALSPVRRNDSAMATLVELVGDELLRRVQVRVAMLPRTSLYKQAA